MRKIVLTFGLIAGAILSVMMAITIPFHDQIGFDKGLIIGCTTMVIAFLMVFVGVKTYRDNVAGGSVTFGRAVNKVGLLIAAVGSICYVATWQLVYYKLAPDYLDRYAAYTIEKERQAGATEAQIATRSQEMAKFKEMYRNPLVNVGLTFLEPLPVGILFTLVTAGVVSRKRRAEGAAVA
jgi:hypothetical protein